MLAAWVNFSAIFWWWMLMVYLIWRSVFSYESADERPSHHQEADPGYADFDEKALRRSNVQNLKRQKEGEIYAITLCSAKNHQNINKNNHQSLRIDGGSWQSAINRTKSPLPRVLHLVDSVAGFLRPRGDNVIKNEVVDHFKNKDSKKWIAGVSIYSPMQTLVSMAPIYYIHLSIYPSIHTGLHGISWHLFRRRVNAPKASTACCQPWVSGPKSWWSRADVVDGVGQTPSSGWT